MLPKNVGSSYIVRFSKEGLKRLRKLDGRTAGRVVDKVDFLRDFRSLNTVKRMSGRYHKDIYRYRIGNVRVLFRVVESEKIVWIIDVGFRGSIYRS